ncbi:hypothetical protein VP01_3553g1 [Puccinia sorghi]|uniref:Uncharacterized protein n=1 Tax=Puccinia sorghi TaxID=27349 RepID=A0A0L6UW88_9BASI|nr:hypothetical protein VP01_3553g1 [Puccinia sorghi]
MNKIEEHGYSSDDLIECVIFLLDWNDDQMRAIREIGNSESKKFWEALLPADFRITNEFVPFPSICMFLSAHQPDPFHIWPLFCARRNVEQFVHDKYVHKKFIQE